MNRSVAAILLALAASARGDANNGNAYNRGLRDKNWRDSDDRKLQDGRHTPVFLFAGQSNMIGHPLSGGCQYTKATEKGSCGVDESELRVHPEFLHNTTIDDIRGQNLAHIVDIINENLPYRKAMTKLKHHLLRVDPAQSEDHAIAWWEAANLLNLDSNYPGLYNAITVELDDVYCSWTEPKEGRVVDLAEAKKLSATSGCGDPFGPELTFSHILETFDEFGIAKVAEGGTTLRHEWNMEESGRCWEVLERQMATLAGLHGNCPVDGSGSCKWHGFVWFQGENDMFLDQEDVRAYGEELRKFVEQTRLEMMVDAAPTFEKPEDIPVVIVQLGCWPGSGFAGQLIMEAERNFVDQAVNAAIVKTNDLSCFYHYDVASQLVIGERIAKAMDGLLAASDAPEDVDGSTKECQSGSALCYDDTDCCSSCNAYHKCREM